MDRHELSDDGIRHPVFTVAVCIFILVFGFLFSCLGAAEEPSDSSQRQMTAAAVSGRRQRPCSEPDNSDRGRFRISVASADLVAVPDCRRCRWTCDLPLPLTLILPLTTVEMAQPPRLVLSEANGSLVGLGVLLRMTVACISGKQTDGQFWGGRTENSKSEIRIGG